MKFSKMQNVIEKNPQNSPTASLKISNRSQLQEDSSVERLFVLFT